MRWVHAAPQLFGWAAVAAVVQESVLGVQLAHTAPPCSARDDGVPKVQLLLIDRLAQRLSYYSRGDLVLVRVPGSTDEHHAMRLVATEGDWVAVPSHLDVRQIPKVSVPQLLSEILSNVTFQLPFHSVCTGSTGEVLVGS